MKTIIAIAAAVMLSGCAQTPLQPIMLDANVIITRTSQIQAGGSTFQVYVDNDAPVNIDRGQTIFFKLKPGTHILRASCSTCSGVGGNSSGYPISVEADKINYLTLSYSMPGTVWIPVVGMFAQPTINFTKTK